MAVKIRRGLKGDLPQVLKLIHELAEYEKAPQEVVVSLADMERDGFGEDPVFRFFVAEHEDSIIGIALYYIKYSTWKGKCIFLEDIIVQEKYRRYGIGKNLFEEVVKAAGKMRARRVEWQVLDWNTPAIKFYEKYNTHFMKEWISCRLTEEEIKRINEQLPVNSNP